VPFVGAGQCDDYYGGVEGMSFKTAFYCSNCEFQSYVDTTIDTEGFEVECPNCHCVWWFNGEANCDDTTIQTPMASSPLGDTPAAGERR
jgi:ribosomal protein L31